MAASDWVVYDNVVQKLGEAGLDLASGSFKMALFGPAFNGTSHADGALVGSLTDQVANGFGYVTGGESIVASWAELSSGLWRFTSSDVTWTANGGSIIDILFAVVYEVNTGILLCYSKLGPAALLVTDTNVLSIAINPAGYFQFTNATAVDFP
jgi:hypothetical protein